MKTAKGKQRTAFTLIEMMVSMGVVTVAGSAIFLAMNSGITLFAKNTSLNLSNQQLLKAIQRITRDAHEAIATPQLLDIDASGNITYHTLSGATAGGPAAGVSFQILWQKPFKITAFVGTGTNKVTINTASVPAASPSPTPPPGPRPTAGQRIFFPGQDAIEDDIIAVAPAASPNTTYSVVTFQNNAWKNLYAGATGYDRTVVIATKIAYVVYQGQLHNYTQQYSGAALFWQDNGARVAGVTTPTPFSLANWTYANAAARTGASGFTPNDLYGIAYQTDTQTYWRLTATTPTWTQDDGNRSITGTFSVIDATYNNRFTGNNLGYQTMGVGPFTFRAPFRTKLSVY